MKVSDFLNPKLSIELVPRTCWYSNVRSEVTRAQWEICKTYVSDRSGDRCEVCGGRGTRWPVECHEIWEYDHETLVQKLVDLVALCPACHEVKHIGRADAVGRGPQAFAHLVKVNGWDEHGAQRYLDHVFRVWDARSQVDWDLDITFLLRLGIEARPRR